MRESHKMKLLRHGVAGFVIFAVLIGLLLNFYTGLEEGYGIERGDTRNTTDTNLTNANIMDQFEAMNLIEGMAGIDAGITELTAPGASLTDIVGALMSVGIGVIKTIIGVLIFPYDIVRIILGYYAGDIPGILGGLVTIVAVYVSFIMLSRYLRDDI